MLSRMTGEITSVSHGPSARVPKDDAALPRCRLAKPQSDTPAAEKKIDFCHRAGDRRQPWSRPRPNPGPDLDSRPPLQTSTPDLDSRPGPDPGHTQGQTQDQTQDQDDLRARHTQQLDRPGFDPLQRTPHLPSSLA